MMFSPLQSQLVEAVIRDIAKERCAMVFFAAMEKWTTNGHQPFSLESLGLLAVLTTDPFNGQPLHLVVGTR